MKQKNPADAREAPRIDRVRSLSISGFKSIKDPLTLEIRPFTLLAGKNSSGKSSALQPLLLLKQSLESPFDSGSLHIAGPYVRFTKAGQLMWRGAEDASHDRRFSIELRHDFARTRLTYAATPEGAEPVECLFELGSGREKRLERQMSREQLWSLWSSLPLPQPQDRSGYECYASKFRGSLKIGIRPAMRGVVADAPMRVEFDPLSGLFGEAIRETIYVPALRGKPGRTHSASHTGEKLAGDFLAQMAGVLALWKEKDERKLAGVSDDLRRLGLTGTVDAKRVDDVNIEIKVGRLPSAKRSDDLVNLADVGSGVSQVLPVVVALRAAKPGQIVYIEEPETHLHPEAQVELARVLLQAAKRDVLIVAETHSDLLFTAVQAQVARREFPSDMVKLYWFARDSKGATRVQAADLDKAGTYGKEWPIDFDDVQLQVQRRFLDASL